MATEKYLDDKESFEALVDRLPPAEARTYRSLRHLQMESAFPGRKMVLYTLHQGRPSGVTLLTFGTLRLDPSQGPLVQVSMDDNEGSFEVGTVPVSLLGGRLFLQVPQKFEFRWSGKQTQRNEVHFAPHYAMLFKSRNRPDRAQDGDTCCVRLNIFREMYPNLNVRY